MKSYIWFLLVVPGLALGIGLCRGAPDGPMGSTRGTVLLMQTGRTMEGDIVRKGSFYCILRGSAEVTIPAENVMRLCQDWDDAVQFMRSRTQLGDPEERLRLAKWCHINNLREYALEEAREAFKMQPGNKEAKQLCEIFERSVKAGANGPTAPLETVPALAPPPQIDISAEALAQFTTKVEPILLNTCVNCHSAGKGGNFQLNRAFEGGQRTATQRNLSAVLSNVNLQRPQFSPILIKAVSLHGNLTQPAIRSRQSVPYITLHDWVESTVANNQHLLNDQSWRQPVYAAPTQQPNSAPSQYNAAPLKKTPPKGEPAPFPPVSGSEKPQFGELHGTVVSTERVDAYRVPLPTQPAQSVVKNQFVPEPRPTPPPIQPEREGPGFIPAEFPKTASRPQSVGSETPPETKLYPPQNAASPSGLQQAAFPQEVAVPHGVAAQVKTAPVTPVPVAPTPVSPVPSATPGRDVYDPQAFNREMHRR